MINNRLNDNQQDLLDKIDNKLIELDEKYHGEPEIKKLVTSSFEELLKNLENLETDLEFESSNESGVVDNPAVLEAAQVSDLMMNRPRYEYYNNY